MLGDSSGTTRAFGSNTLKQLSLGARIHPKPTNLDLKAETVARAAKIGCENSLVHSLVHAVRKLRMLRPGIVASIALP